MPSVGVPFLFFFFFLWNSHGDKLATKAELILITKPHFRALKILGGFVVQHDIFILHSVSGYIVNCGCVRTHRKNKKKQ